MNSEINNAYYVFGVKKFRNIEKIDEGTSRLDGQVFNNEDLFSRLEKEYRSYAHYGILSPGFFTRYTFPNTTQEAGVSLAEKVLESSKNDEFIPIRFSAPSGSLYKKGNDIFLLHDLSEREINEILTSFEKRIKEKIGEEK